MIKRLWKRWKLHRKCNAIRREARELDLPFIAKLSDADIEHGLKEQLALAKMLGMPTCWLPKEAGDE